MTLTFLLLAVGVVIAPAPRLATARARGPSTPPAPPDRSRTLTVVAVVAAAAACLLMWGPLAGSAAALGVTPGVLLGVRALRRRVPSGPTDPSLPLAIDLVAAALRAGRPLGEALLAAVPAAAADTRAALTRVAGLLRLGANPDQAWSVLARDGPLAPLAAVAVRSATSGVRLATSFERLAGQLRDDAVAVAAARAQRAGVRAMGPLAACFLPSFVCLGVVPVIVGVARTALRGVLP